jgi:hypothetical protein
MATFPGMEGDVYFGDPETDELPDWRKEMPEGGSDDDDDAEPTAKDLASVKAILGFDPNEADEPEDAEN